MVQWLRVYLQTQRRCDGSLVGELRSHAVGQLSLTAWQLEKDRMLQRRPTAAKQILKIKHKWQCTWSEVLHILWKRSARDPQYVCVISCSVVPTLCNPMDCNSPGSSVHRILQTRKLEWVAISFSRGSSQPRDRTQVSHIADSLFWAIWAIREALWYPQYLWAQISQQVHLTPSVVQLAHQSSKVGQSMLWPALLLSGLQPWH